MEARRQAQLVQFLQQEMAIPASSLKLALQHPEQGASVLPMILWQYGLISLSQLDQIFDWLEHSISI